MSEPFAGLPRRHFGAIVIDPPWKFKARSALKMANWKSPRHIERHYQTMTAEEIFALPIRDLAARDCHLFLCATGPCLKQAFAALEAWGFRYSSMAFVWVKMRRSLDPGQVRILPSSDSELHVGLGLTTRKNAEFVLLGRRGSPRRVARDVREIIMSPVREHSRKPDDLFMRVQKYCAGPYLELFARQSRDGWTTWGLERTKFDKPYDGQDDFAKSLDVGYAAIRDRVAAGGPGWEPKP
jgi:N6-adenosine-specific RNA methylase IME4